MCNGGEGRTLKPCCDAALASSKAYISNGPAKAHSLPSLPPPPSALPPLNPSLPGPPRLALAPASLLLLHPSLPLPPFLSVLRSLARSRARAPASTIPVLGVLLLPHSWVPSRRAAETLGREVEYERPYTNHRATVLPGLILSLPFSLPPLSLSVTLPPVSSSAASFSSPFVPLLLRFFFLFHIPRLCPSQSRSQLLLYLFHLYESFFFFVFFSFSPSLNFWHRS